MPINLFVDLFRGGFNFFLAILLVCCTYELDAQEIQFVRDRRLQATPESDRFWNSASQVSYPLAIGTPLVQLGLGYRMKNKTWIQEGWQSVAGVALSAAMGYTMKETIRRNRPFIQDPTLQPYQQETGYSCPSGTTTMAFTWATHLSLSVPKWYVAVPAYAVASGIGYSRIALGAHYPTDVLAGAALGTGSAFVSRWLTQKIRFSK